MSQEVKIEKKQTTLCDLGGQFFLKSQYPLIKLLDTLQIEYDESEKSTGKLLGTFKRNYTSNNRPPQFGNLYTNIELINFFGKV